MIRLEEVNEDNWREDLAVAPEQKTYVANAVTLMARAYAYRKYNSYACVIYDDDTPVGMALYYDCPDYGAYDFSQFFIDERYQGRGYGKQAAQMILDRMRSEGRYSKAVLCFIDGNDAAKSLYEGLGFHLTGEEDEDEIIMEMEL